MRGKPIHTLYKDCAIQASKDLVRSWIIIPSSILAYIVYTFAIGLFAPIGFAGGFIIGFIEIALLALYYGWLTEAQTRAGLTYKNIFEYDYQLFFQVISAAFILFIAKYLVSGIASSSPDLQPLPYFVQLAIVVLFNALPEVLYKKRYESIEALQYASWFTKEYWIEWFIPFLILVAPAIYLSTTGFVTILAVADEFLPVLTIIKVWSFFGGMQALVFSLLGLILGTWLMIFRGRLFEALDR